MSAQLQLKTTPATKATMASKAVTPVLTASDIALFVEEQVQAPELSYTAIDTSDIRLIDFRNDDADINKAFGLGFERIQVVNELDEIVPNARLKVTYKGHDYKVIPFMPLILAANQAKMVWSTESQFKKFANQGSLKERGSFKFQIRPEELEALQAKQLMVWRDNVKVLSGQFITWLDGFTPKADLLPVLWESFTANAILILFDGAVYIRQVVADANAETVTPLSNELLELQTSSHDDLMRNTSYTFKLKV